MNNDLQRTAEWFQERLGHLTASVAGDVLARTAKGLKTAKYEGRLHAVMVERLTGQAVPVFVNQAMIWGTEHEEEAAKAYEVLTGNFVEEAGFFKHPTIKYLGASPDGLIGEDGLLEIKCPDTTTHIRRLLADVVPEDRKPQLLIQLACTGRKWVDFVDYDPRLTDEFKAARIFVKRFEPTAEEISKAEELAKEFLDDVEKSIAQLKKQIEDVANIQRLKRKCCEPYTLPLTEDSEKKKQEAAIKDFIESNLKNNIVNGAIKNGI